MEQQRKIIVAADDLHFQRTEKRGWIKVDINTDEMSTWLSPTEVENLIEFLQKNKKERDA